MVYVCVLTQVVNDIITGRIYFVCNAQSEVDYVYTTVWLDIISILFNLNRLYLLHPMIVSYTVIISKYFCYSEIVWCLRTE